MYCGCGLTDVIVEKERPALFGVGRDAGDTRGGETPGGGGFKVVGVLKDGVLVKRSRFCARKVVGVW